MTTSHHGIRILVADDEPLSREMLGDVLRSCGYMVETAQDGFVAIEKLREGSGFDLILSDLMMPSMSGIELIRELRCRNLNVPVVVLVNSDGMDAALEALSAGAEDFILRDHNIHKTIGICLGRILERRHLRKHNAQLLEELACNRERLEKERALAQDVARKRDVDALLENILSSVRELLNADAGSIYIKNGDQLEFQYTQNDTLQKRLRPGKKLIYSTYSLPINNESIAGYVANNARLLNIADVYRLPAGAPFSFSRRFDEISGYLTKSMLVVPLINNRDDAIGVLQVINAKGSDGQVVPFSKMDESLILNFANNAAIALERAQMTRAIILRMIRMAELHDPKETGQHVNRVASYAVEIYDAWARGKGLPAKQIERDKDTLRMAAMLHDVGKIAIPDTILKKPGRLDADEYTIMKQHTYLGARLFSNFYSDLDEASLAVVLNHHERWDGCGYPGHIDYVTGRPLSGYEDARGIARGKGGEEIPPFARVVAIADVYDALCSRRVYKESWDELRALEIMKDEAGKQFDPEMIEAFLSILDVIHNVAQRYPERHKPAR